MATEKTVLILGGGIGGIIAAKTLRKLLPLPHRIVLIEKEREHYFAPSLLWMITGNRSAAQISKPITKLTHKGIEVIQGDIEKILPDERKVMVSGKEIQGDYLLIAMGAELAPELVPGLEQAGHNLYSLKGAEAICNARRDVTEGDIMVLVCATPFKCPAAPYEAAMLLEADCRKRGVRAHTHISIYTPEPGPMPVAGPIVSGQVKQMVESKAIRYFPQWAVDHVDAIAKTIAFTNQQSAHFDLLIYIPPHRAPAPVRAAGLTNEAGWIPVDRTTMATQYPQVYAVGDVTTIPLTNGRPLPKAGVFAHAQAEVVAHNIAGEILGYDANARFEGLGKCFLETGDGMAGMGAGNFYAQPDPVVHMKSPSRLLHLGKIAYEKMWLYGI